MKELFLLNEAIKELEGSELREGNAFLGIKARGKKQREIQRFYLFFFKFLKKSFTYLDKMSNLKFIHIYNKSNTGCGRVKNIWSLSLFPVTMLLKPLEFTAFCMLMMWLGRGLVTRKAKPYSTFSLLPSPPLTHGKESPGNGPMV